MSLQFGTGAVFLAPTGGNLATNPTPFPAAAIQSAQVDFKRDNVTAFGQNQFPIVAAPGQMSVTGKLSLLNFDPRLLNQIFFGQAETSGGVVIVQDEVGTVPAATTYTVSVTNAATFSFNYGVKYADTGIQFTKVDSNPTVGEYSVADGVYTFAADDAGVKVKISYTYAATDTTLATITLLNKPQGYGPIVRVGLGNSFQNKRFALELYQCIFSDFSVPTKQKGLWEMAMSFDAFTDASDTLGTLSGDVS